MHLIFSAHQYCEPTKPSKCLWETVGNKVCTKYEWCEIVHRPNWFSFYAMKMQPWNWFAQSLTNFSLHSSLQKSQINYLALENHPSYFSNWLWSFLASLKKAWVFEFFLLVVLQQREMERYPIFFPGLWEKPSRSSQSLLCLGEHNPVRFHQPTKQQSAQNTQHRHYSEEHRYTEKGRRT